MNTSELFDFIPRMTDNEKSFIFNLSLVEKIIFSSLFIWSIVWGTLMKLFLYYNLKQEKMSERPINVLILVDQLIEHATNFILIVNSTIKVTDFKKKNSLKDKI